MNEEFRKSEFQKGNPVDTCGVCGAKEEFVLVRRPMQEAYFDPGHRPETIGKMKYRDSDGWNTLYSKLCSNLFNRLDEPAIKFGQAIHGWSSELRRFREHRVSNHLYEFRDEERLVVEQHLGDRLQFFHTLVALCFRTNREAIRKLWMKAAPKPYTFRETRSHIVRNRIFDEETERICREFSNRFSGEILRNQVVGAHVLKEMLSGILWGEAVRRLKQPRVTKLHSNVVSMMQDWLQNFIDDHEVDDINWQMANLTNDPSQVDCPMPVTLQIKKQDLYEGTKYCGHCGAVQSRTLNVKFSLQVLQPANPDTNSENHAPKIVYDGPIQDLYENVKPQLDEIWTDPLDELEERISEASKLLEEGEKSRMRRVADAREQARQKEIKSLKKKLESLEKEE